MDDKTAELRDIFLDATDGEGTVTERQAERRGSLVDGDPEAVDASLRDLVATMRDRYDFDTDLDADGYVRLIRGFYDGTDDDTLAEAVIGAGCGVVLLLVSLHVLNGLARFGGFLTNALLSGSTTAVAGGSNE